MAKVTVSGIKGRPQVYHAVYDFEVDGGTNGAGNEIDLFTLSADTIVHDMWAEVETAVVGTLSTIEVGVTGGDTDSIIKQTAEATLVANYVTSDDDKGAAVWDDVNKHSIRYKVTAATDLSMLIGTADLTAGKVHFYVVASAGY